jgi:ADP-ribosylglycohydrolase
MLARRRGARIGPLLAQALGDAYGAGFEFTPENRHLNDLTCYRRHPRLPLGGGRYTDDTQMSIAIAEAILAWSTFARDDLARYFFAAFKRDPRPGYSAAFYDILQRAQSSGELLARLNPTSEKNGAAMRAPVIGLLPDCRDVIDYAIRQATVTHDTTPAKTAAIAAALATHYFHYGLGPKAALGAWLEAASDGLIGGVPWSAPWSGEVGTFATDAVRAAVTAVQARRTLGDVLKACVDFGGDVDTVAAIAMPAASRSREIEDDIPDALVEQLEDGRWGRRYLRALDEQLLARWPGAGVARLPRDIECFLRWLEIREREQGRDRGSAWSLRVDALHSALHSALLQRLLDGDEPLPKPPPRAFSYPWYELLERGCADAFEVWSRPGSTEVVINQYPWKLVRERAPNDWEVTYGDGSTLWRCYCAGDDAFGKKWRLERIDSPPETNTG